jgi:hypothetical protein
MKSQSSLRYVRPRNNWLLTYAKPEARVNRRSLHYAPRDKKDEDT